MAERMVGLRISITRYVGDEPQPGIVECELTDANACEIVSRGQEAADRQILCVDTERPWGVASIDGTTKFKVLPSTLVEWELEE